MWRVERRGGLCWQNKTKKLFKQEVVAIHQKVRIKWLKNDDLDSKFFHSIVKWRRVRNGLNGLFVNGRWCEDKKVVKDKVRDFFKVRFKGLDGPQIRLDNVSFNSISNTDNKMLVIFFSKEEVKFAIWNCDSSKSLELDGFNLCFIKFCWDFFKDDILLAVNDFAVSDKWPRGMNTLFVCLVPKFENPQQLCDFRPISLVGCMY